MEMADSDMAEAAGMVAKMWWVWLVTGIIWVILSLVILQFNTASATTVGVLIGIFFILAGLQNFFIGYVAEGWKWLWIVFGVLFIIAGIVALVYPKDVFADIASALGFLFLVFGVFWIVEALATREANNLWWMGLIAGILLVILAFWAAGQFFMTKAYTLLVFGGIWALMHGIMDIIRAFEVRKFKKLIVE
ncbi:MAG: DUF308 domain-containing protein [Actinobacteria bacterium]|nr:DUF308 domain-containing protein [Actinomycetota bacterium]MBU1943210.1 DUF308 domain-containing protein [Actinomycetota bacterium]MBU2686231.1 DUF308 domain-containing protein [Actinomycetota bacterium]